MSIFNLTPVRAPRKEEKTAAYPRPNRVADFRNFAGRFHFGPLAAKIAVVVGFTLGWLLIILVRSHEPHDPATLESSSLIGLASAMQQGAISGRDFQSAYGPAAQLLARAATTLSTTRSALDAYGLIVFSFCAGSALLMAAMFLLCDRISWKQAAVFYALSILLNLFYEVLDIRTALLLLNAVFAYRTIAAETLPQRTAWAEATGLLCFLSQLVTFELGIYAALVVVCALISGAALTRNTRVLYGVQAFVATFAVSNLCMAAYFKLTSSSDALFFDYHNYGFEILRGYHNSMGTPWGLPLTHTVVLVIAALYVVGMCVLAAWRSDPLDASLLVSLGFAAVVWLKTASVTSDVPHIVFAFTPVVVVLSLLVPRDWSSPKESLVWATIAVSLIVAWPSFNFTAPTDLLKVVRGEVGAGTAIRELHTTRRPLEKSLQASLATPELADRQKVPLLAFPYDNQIGVGARRPFFAPVLESYGASTRFLEEYYVRALQKQQRAGLEIVYGLDSATVPLIAGLQAITRTPIIFEYIYRNFELVSKEDHADGHYILRAAYQPPAVAIEPLKFSMLQQSLDSGVATLAGPSTCGLVRVEMRIRYATNSQIFRPSGVEVSLRNGEEPVWRGFIRPLEPNQTFVTYISPLHPDTFHKVFGRDPIQGIKWDKFQYHSLPADLLGSTASRIDVSALQCLDPQKFVELRPAL